MPIDHLNPPTGLFADNIVGFARALRAAGMSVGASALIDAFTALQTIDIGNRADFYAALESVFVKRREHRSIFAQAFDLFFRAEEDWKHMLDSIPLPDHARKKPPPGSRRVQEAMAKPRQSDSVTHEQQDIRLSTSDQEVLQTKDFAQMSAAEIDEARRAIEKMHLPQAQLRTRRFMPDAYGRRIDFSGTIRASLRSHGEMLSLRHKGPIEKPAPIVALLDISGSMSDYTRLFLHFLHAITDARSRVSVFLFGTRLTNVTRSLRLRDPDEALARCSGAVEDWAGGTRIAPSLHLFNKLWARRVLGQGAVVLLISDGLEREADTRLAFEMDRLHRSCRRLIWLNPLLRFDGFEPKAQGIRMMLPHVDEFRPVHNLSSMATLIDALSRPLPAQRKRAA